MAGVSSVTLTRRRRARLAVLVGCLFAVGSTNSQDRPALPPTIDSPVDSTHAGDPGRHPSSDSSDAPGYVSSEFRGENLDTNPRLAASPEFVHILSRELGAFGYDLATPGWPHVVSLFGADPNAIGLRYGGISLDDLLSGRPRYEFAPVMAIDSISLATAAHGSPLEIALLPRDYAGARPLTEALYWTSNKGLQSVGLTHSQNRKQRFGGNDGKLGLLAGYHGIAAAGEYPSAKLQRGRQLLGRVRYQQKRWSLEITELYNRRSVGQHGGVNPPIFRRLEAGVANSGASRQTRRNDLSTQFKLRTIHREALTASLGYSRQTDVFLSGVPSRDTTRTKMDRIGFSAEQPLVRSAVGLALFGNATVDRIRSANWIPDSMTIRSRVFAAGVRVTVRANVDIESEVSLVHTGSETGPAASVLLKKNLGRVVVHASGGVSPQRQALLFRNGFSTPGATMPDSILAADGTDRRSVTARAGVTLTAGQAALSLIGYVNGYGRDNTEYAESGGTDVINRATMPSSTDFGATGLLSIRGRSSRGIYASVSPTLNLRPSSVSDLARTTALPRFHVQGRVGARYSLFEDDLKANIYLRARYWSAFAGRTLNLPTSLLILSASTSTVIPSSSTVDLVIEAGIRTATLFLTYENAFAGTNVLEGNFLVAGYPLAEQRLRFGVFWPILD